MVSRRIYPFRPEWLTEEGPGGVDVTTLDHFRWWLAHSGTDFRHSERPEADGDVFLYAWKQQQGVWAIVGEARVREIETNSEEPLKYHIRTFPGPEVYSQWVPWVRVFPGDRFVQLSQSEYETVRRKGGAR